MVSTRSKSSQFYEFLGNQHDRLRWIYRLISHVYHRFKLNTGQLRDLRLASATPSKTFTFQADGLTLVGDFYAPKAPHKASTILLLHGSSVFGRKLSLMRSLAGEFQKLGYAVLTFDLRGYGASQDPQDYTPEAFDFANDVRAAIDYAIAQTPEYAERFYVIGHSFGGAVALAAQAKDPRIAKIVSFGPPRRLSERFLNPEAREKKKLLVRWQADMQLSQPLDFQMWQQVLQPLNIENYIKPFCQPNHTPVFLIDAEQEPEADLAFLREIYRQIKPPAAYWTVPATDHYLGTGFLFGIPCYSRRLLLTFVRRVDQWLQQPNTLSDTPTHDSCTKKNGSMVVP